jgi:ParB family chromosome partitioning protein
VGRSRPAVSNRLRLLDLPDDVLELVDGGSLSEGHARAVLALSDQGDRRSLARRIAAEGLSVRAAERAAREGGARRKRRSAPAGIDPALAARARAAAERVTGLRAAVRPGRLEIAFADEGQLEQLVEALERAAQPPVA